MKALAKLEQYRDVGLLALRIALAAIFIVHGYGRWSVWGMSPSDQMPAGMLYLMRFLSIAEPLGALGLLIGLLSRLASLGLIFPMLGAITFKITMWNTGFMGSQTTGWEFDFLILCSLICLLTTGPGKFSVEGSSPKAS